MIKLSILITQYKEKFEVIKPMLDSIAAQQRVNLNEIEVVILNDGSRVHLNIEEFEKYPFTIRYQIEKNNVGVALARQKLFDMTSTPYLMYCDADDSFYSVLALKFIFEEIEKGFDTLVTNFYEEIIADNGNSAIVLHNDDKVFVHGKVYRRDFLREKNISWIDICPSEDNYYNKLARSLSDDIRIIETPLYLWRWRSDSIVRSNKETWVLNVFPVSSLSEEYLIDELLKRDKLGEALYYIVLHIYQGYFVTNRDNWHEEKNKSFLNIANNRLSYFINKYLYYWDMIPQKEKDEVYNQNIKLQTARGFVKRVEFSDWFKERVRYGSSR